MHSSSSQATTRKSALIHSFHLRPSYFTLNFEFNVYLSTINLHRIVRNKDMDQTCTTHEKYHDDNKTNIIILVEPYNLSNTKRYVQRQGQAAFTQQKDY